ncbi:uncharacterized protein LTR77_001254 [Saxophila tyrrhenica]|uniref:Dynactin subunit 6 n=1 Tax=Saxophila tyrrhenica TaxID=1690608 RepID=A0AAV9PN78_9PEZI|nr:hypothetical protein LTR77_001254 [Saxophila tyrrhenica]
MTSKPAAPSNRQSSSAIPLVKPQCKIHPSATVADKAQLIGPHVIEIDEGAVIHPHAKIKAEYGNIAIGKGTIVSEKAIVGLSEESGEDTTLVVGEGVSIESGAIVEARKIGDHATLGINCRVGEGAVLGKWCKIAPLCEVGPNEVLDDYTVVFGEGRKGRRVDVVVRDRKEVREARLKGTEMERQLLRGIIVDMSLIS